MTEARTIEMGRYWDCILRRRGFILKLAGAATAIGVVGSLLLPAWYRATASLLPPSEAESGFGLSSLLKGFGVPGVKVPTEAQPADVFIAELDSRRINDEIVRRFDLQKLYRKRLREDALKELRRHVGFSVSDAGLISISVEDRDPRRAAEMANAYVDILDHFNREVRMTKGRRTREFVQHRLDSTRTDLRTAESRLQAYLTKHKTLALSAEISSAVEVAARLYAQRAAAQVQLGVAEGYSRGDNDETMRLRQQVAQMDQQLAALPATGVESARLLRDVRMLETLAALLTGQFEEARINEWRNVATVEVLDAAQVPEHRTRPNRALIVAVSLVMGLGAGVGVALLDARSDAVAAI
jgi:uncharacterized protein involved in exopolysaccharide biosynthesis